MHPLVEQLALSSFVNSVLIADKVKGSTHGRFDRSILGSYLSVSILQWDRMNGENQDEKVFDILIKPSLNLIRNSLSLLMMSYYSRTKDFKVGLFPNSNFQFLKRKMQIFPVGFSPFFARDYNQELEIESNRIDALVNPGQYSRQLNGIVGLAASSASLRQLVLISK